jgi:2'-5' RNA ligase
MLRTFIAVQLIPEIKNLIADIQTGLKGLPCDVKWVNPEIAHLTLRFIGSVNSEAVDDIVLKIDNAVNGHHAFDLSTTKAGAFPDKKRPRVIWLGLNDPLNSAALITKDIDLALESAGIPKEDDRPFSPHITLGRVRSPKNVKYLTNFLDKQPVYPSIKQTVNKIILFKSTLGCNGPTYEILKEFRLKQ